MKRLVIFLAVATLAMPTLAYSGPVSTKQLRKLDQRVIRLEKTYVGRKSITNWVRNVERGVGDAHTRIENIHSRVQKLENRPLAFPATLHAFDAEDAYIGPIIAGVFSRYDNQWAHIYAVDFNIVVAAGFSINYLTLPNNDEDGPYNVIQQWSDQVLHFTGTDCTGEVLIREHESNHLDPPLMRVGHIWNGVVYVTADGQTNPTPASDYSVFNRGCRNRERYPYGTSASVYLNLTPLSDWPYKLPITLELR